jgi:hypothetical protein
MEYNRLTISALILNLIYKLNGCNETAATIYTRPLRIATPLSHLYI